MEKMLTMLIVDDMPKDRDQLRDYFYMDYNILAAESGKEALEFLRSGQRIDVVLLNVMIQEEKGMDILEIIKNDPELYTIPVAMCADEGEERYEARALSHGAEEFLSKKSSQDVIQQRVNNMVRRCVVREQMNNFGISHGYIAEKDSVTGLMSKENFYRRVKEYMKEDLEEVYYLCVWNIDRFKVVNELFGSQIGNMVLFNTAQALNNLLGENALCTRTEADHFAFCITKAFFEENLPQIEEVLSGQDSLKINDYAIQIHMGIYEVEDREMSVDIMCDRADMALRGIKESYVTRWDIYSEELKTAMMVEQELISEMESALRSGQFVVVFQPIVDTDSKKTISAEALIRWNHPIKGMISPGVFIPLFERNGFIAVLDLFVCEEVCKFQASRIKEGLPTVPVSVNISRINFYRPDFGKEILHLLEKYNVAPELIKLEITEGGYIDNPKSMIEAIHEFQSKSFKIMMDDFGSGYSSLNMLKDFNVDVLKIDMKFINDLETSDRANNILFTIIQMAKALEMETVAEGVETKAQYDVLASMGCDSIQGYFFSKPISQEEFGSRLVDEKDQRFEVNEVNSRQTILVVDDQFVERSIIRKMVGDKYEVIEASNGQEALDILKKSFRTINLVLSDVRMPEMTGLEFLSKKNDSIFLRDIPVIMLTAFGEKENEEKALALGALDIITKPYDGKIVRKRIENILKISKQGDMLKKIKALKEQAE